MRKRGQAIFLTFPWLFSGFLWRTGNTSYAALQNPPDPNSLASQAVATGSMWASISFLKADLDGISWKAQPLYFSFPAWGLPVTLQCGNLSHIPTCTIWKSKGLRAHGATIDQWKSMNKGFLLLSWVHYIRLSERLGTSHLNPWYILGWPTEKLFLELVVLPSLFLSLCLTPLFPGIIFPDKH